jgi:ubiquinone biosynthesis accessory factor UbiK
MQVNNILEDMQKRIQSLITNSPLSDVEKNVKAILAQGFNKLDLVTREEFDRQVKLTQRLRERLETLENRVNLLEQQKQTTPQTTLEK